jgi:HK97 gp10 family phage protein
MAKALATLGVSVAGLDDLEAMFREIGPVGAADSLRAAAKKALVPVAEEARRRAPRGTGTYTRKRLDGTVETIKRPHLAESIAIRSSLSKSQMRRRGGRKAPVEVFVGATAPFAHLVEFGHMRVVVERGELQERRVKGRDGRLRVRGLYRPIIKRTVVGHVAAKPFLRPAFDSKKEESTKIFIGTINGEVLRVARRYLRQAERGKLSRGAKLAFKAELLL